MSCDNCERLKADNERLRYDNGMNAKCLAAEHDARKRAEDKLALASGALSEEIACHLRRIEALAPPAPVPEPSLNAAAEAAHADAQMDTRPAPAPEKEPNETDAPPEPDEFQSSAEAVNRVVKRVLHSISWACPTCGSCAWEAEKWCSTVFCADCGAGDNRSAPALAAAPEPGKEGGK